MVKPRKTRMVTNRSLATKKTLISLPGFSKKRAKNET